MKRKFVYIGVVVFFLTFVLVDYFKIGYAIPAPELYVYLELNGGGLFEEDKKNLFDNSVPLSFNGNNIEQKKMPHPYKAGFFLEGWYADKNLTREVFKEGEVTTLNQLDLKSERYGSYSTTIYAKWRCVTSTGGSLTIHFETNGGDRIDEKSICTVCTPSPEDEVLPILERNGYKFIGWYVDKELTRKANDIYDVNAETEYYDKERTCPTNHSRGTLYAKWEKIQNNNCIQATGGSLTILFDTNGGNSINNYSICTMCGEDSVNLPEPVRAGYRFIGWYADKELTKRVSITSNHSNDLDRLKKEVVKDRYGCNTTESRTTLYAKWEKESCMEVTGGNLTISFDTGGVTEIKDINICTTCSEEKIKLPIPVKKGYLFLGWYNDKEYSNLIDIDSSLDSDISKLDIIREVDGNGCETNSSKTTLYARWLYYAEDVSVVVKYIDGDKINEVTYDNKDSSELMIPEKDGYKFVGLYTDEDYTYRVNSFNDIDNAKFDMIEDGVSTKLYIKWEKDEDNNKEQLKHTKSYKLVGIVAVLVLVVIGCFFLVRKKKVLDLKK
ncbi:MAG TPA: hypothetical protein DCE23_00020 [Firmicutes bacterium]|nr:hypothetical protein [Bacillota bacterium]